MKIDSSFYHGKNNEVMNISHPTDCVVSYWVDDMSTIVDKHNFHGIFIKPPFMTALFVQRITV